MNTEEPRIPLMVTGRQVEIILNGLAQLPWAQSNAVIMNVQQQVVMYQNQQIEQGEEDAPEGT